MVFILLWRTEGGPKCSLVSSGVSYEHAVASRRQILTIQWAGRKRLILCESIPEMNAKIEPRTGYYIDLRSGAIGENMFTSVELPV
jgi:hypothetical protein